MDDFRNIPMGEGNNPLRRKKFWKFWLMMALINVGFLLIIFRLFIIQVVNAEKYSELARRQHESKVVLRAERGAIHDRKGRLLAATIRSVSVAVDPKMLKNKEKVAAAIARATGMDKFDVLGRIESTTRSFLWIKRGIMPGRAEALTKLNDPGLIIIPEPKRIYPYGRIGAQLIGATDIDNRGISGIELRWDSLLRGSAGYMIMRRDALGRKQPAADLPLAPPVDGNSLRLTIDIDLQSILEYELRQGVLSSRAESGTAIVLHPATGEVLAMASYPGFDPNRITRESESSLRNQAVTDLLEPGSTFKLITAAAALEENVVTPDMVFDGHKGRLRVGRVTIDDSHPLDQATFREAVEHSSNIIFSKIATKIPDNLLYKYIRDFGFGIALDIELPGEVSGKILKPDELTSTMKRFVGFGYGISATPLQLANAYSTVANHGEMMRPMLVRNINTPSGSELREFRPEKIRRVISPRTADTLAALLTGVVDSGTGRNARIEGIRIAGKTGTSQQYVGGVYSKRDYNASFAGFFPADDPQLALFIIIDRPKGNYYGGAAAAPVFRNIAARTMNAFEKYIYADSDAEYSAPDSVFAPNVRGMTPADAESTLELSGLDYESEGAGAYVSAQNPAAGILVPTGSEVMVTLSKWNYTNIDSLKANFDPVGLPVRRAVALLHRAGIEADIIGSGYVHSSGWIERSGRPVCRLRCK
ncbi:MAG: penicillin-binding transpeptidase domain-containing protein [Candidatus Kapaibacterium sp.]